MGTVKARKGLGPHVLDPALNWEGKGKTMNETLNRGPVVKVELANKNRYRLTYENGSTRDVPRVTTVLDTLNKPALMHWAANEERAYCIEKAIETIEGWPAGVVMTDETFEEAMLHRLGDKKAHSMKSRRAMGIGSHIHEMIQLHLKNEKDTKERPEKAILGFMAWEDWRKSVEFEPVHVEQAIGSDRLGVGGTVDAAGWASVRPGQRTFLVPDWKSNNVSKMRPDGIYDENLIQAAVYCQILIEMGEAPEDSWAGVVRLPKNEDDPCIQEGKSIDYRLLSPEERHKLAEGFEHIRATWEFLEGGVL